MKKFDTTKIVSLVMLLVVLASTVAGAYLGIAGRNTQMVTILEDGQPVERALYRQVAFIPNIFNKNWTEAITPSAQLNGGYSYTLTADQGDMSDADFEKALKTTAKIVAQRSKLALGDATAKVQDNAIVLTVPTAAYDALVPMIATPVGEVTFCLVDAATGMLSDPLLTAADVKNAGYGMMNNTYTLQVQLTSKAAKTVNEHLGETLYIVQDGQAIAYTTLTSPLNNNLLEASINDWTLAFVATVCLKTDILPAGYLSLTAAEAATATMPGVLDAIIVVCGVITVLAALWMILHARVAGLAAALVLAAQCVVFWLLAALISVSSAWKMTLVALLVIVVCQMLFVALLVLITKKIATAQKQPRPVG